MSVGHLIIVGLVVLLVGPKKAGKTIQKLMSEFKKLRTQTGIDEWSRSTPTTTTTKPRIDLNAFAEHKIEQGTKLTVNSEKQSPFDQLETARKKFQQKEGTRNELA